MNPTPKGSRRQGAKAEAETQSPAPRSSSEVRAAIEKLAAETEQAKRQLSEHAKTWEAALLADDAVAEAHEAETARLRRAIARGELVQQQLATELNLALASEEAARLVAKKAAAEKAVQSVLASVHDYVAAATTIAGFLERWRTASLAAMDAGIPTPNRRLRVRKGRVDGDRRVLDVSIRDEMAGPREVANVAATFPGARHPDVELPDLSTLVKLPGLSADGGNYWPR